MGWKSLGSRWTGLCLFAFASTVRTGWGQQTLPGFSENLVFLDAAHGGADPGAHLGGSTEEKALTLALAARVRIALVAKGFTVVMSREGDSTMTSEQRANAANHARPLACFLLHASASGNGVTLALSTLAAYVEPGMALPWARAQASYVGNSMGLRELVAGAMKDRKLGTLTLRASTPPIDSLTCAAMIVEMGMLGNTGAGDADYQTKVAEAIAEGVAAWKAQVVPAKAPALAKPVAVNGLGLATPGRAAGATP